MAGVFSYPAICQPPGYHGQVAPVHENPWSISGLPLPKGPAALTPVSNASGLESNSLLPYALD